MGDRRFALSVTFNGVGRGAVLRETTNPSEDLARPVFQPNQPTIFPVTNSPETKNLHLLDGVAKRRPGYAEKGTATTPGDFTVNGMFIANFADGRTYLVRGLALNPAVGTSSRVEVWDPVANDWEDLTGSLFNNVATQPWTFTMGPKAADKPPTQLLMGNEASEIYVWDGITTSGTPATLLGGTPPRGPKVLSTFLSHAIAFNVIDPATGDRKHSRLQGSIVGDSSNWTGLGSFAIDLEDDPYPGVAMLPMGGRLCLWKGDRNGGAIYVATPTGNATSPLRIDAVNPETNIGAYFPRSVIALTPTTAFFLGHDAAYLYDGVRGLLPFAQSVAKDLIERANPNALSSAWTIYHREDRIVELFVATGSATTPNESWLFDIDNRRAFGPSEYTNSFVAGVSSWYQYSPVTWETWGQSSGRTWDTLDHHDDSGDEYVQWDLIEGTADTTESSIVGSIAGDSYEVSDASTDDDGVDISCEYYFPPITPQNWLVQRGKEIKRLRPDDVLALKEVVIRHKGTEAWTPIVEVSTDGGGSWTLFSDATAISDTTVRLLSKTYYNDNIQGTWIQVRVRNTDGDAFNLHSGILEFTYAGSERHE